MTKESDKSRSTDVENSLVMIMKNYPGNDADVSIISLGHPRYGTKTKFLLNKANKTVHEIQTFSEEHSSWLIDNTLRSNGNLYISTPIDPLFLVLPFIKEECSKRAVPLDHLLASSELAELEDIITDMECIADSKGSKQLSAYQYNENKTLDWLKIKTERVVKVLKTKNSYIKSGIVSATFVTSTLEPSKADDGLYLKSAFEIVSEYLTDEFSEMLRKHLDIPEEAETNLKRKNVNDDEANGKRAKIDYSAIDDSKSPVKKKVKAQPAKSTPSAKEKQKIKAAAGSKNIMSFFAKK